MSQLKKGAILSYATIFLTNGVGLVLTPFIVRSLGDSEYGLYTLIGAFIGYMAVLDLGLNNTIIRYVAKYRAEKDEKGESNFLATIMLIYSIISIIVVIVGVVLYFNLDEIFINSLNPEEFRKAKIMFLILLGNIAITLPGNAFEAICIGHEQFVYPKKMRIIRYIIRSIAIVGLLVLKGGAIGLVVIDTVMNVTIILSNALFVFRKLNVRFKFLRLDKGLIQEIFGYSFWIFLMAIVYQFQWKSGQFLLGITTDTVTVAVFAIGILLGTYYGTFATAITNLLIPKAMKLVVEKASGKKITKMAIKIGRIILLLLYLLLGGFIIFGEEFVVLWVGVNYMNSWIIAVLIMITLTNSLVQAFLTSVLKAKNLYRFKSITYLSLVSLGLVLGYFLISKYQEIGMILGLCVGILLSQLVLNLYLRKKLGFEIFNFYKETFFKTTLFLLLFLFLGYGINLIYPSYTWLGFLLKSGVYVTLYVVIHYYFVFNEFEKATVANLMKKVMIVLKNGQRI